MKSWALNRCISHLAVLSLVVTAGGCITGTHAVRPLNKVLGGCVRPACGSVGGCADGSCAVTAPWESQGLARHSGGGLLRGNSRSTRGGDLCGDGYCNGQCGGKCAAAKSGRHGKMAAFAQHIQNACASHRHVLPAGPTEGAVTYPYYTTRGPRDYLDPNPPSIGP